jgi:hypothetical protein
MNRPSKGMKAATAIMAVFIAVCALSSCASSKGSPEMAGLRGGRFTLELSPGSSYKFHTWWLIFPVPIYPQVACWIETPQGEYIGTIYATAKGAKKAWLSAPATGRPEALPVWFHLQGKGEASADTVSGATPSGATKRDSSLADSLKPGAYVVKLEINRSYDYNDRYTRANSGVVGQPSLVYACEIAVGSGSSKAVFKPIGTGALDGSDGNVRPGLDGITTALQLFSSAAISYEEDYAK